MTFPRLCLATCLVIFVLIVIGGVVRATESGLGCPDWPTCHGRLIPEWEKHTMIEYTHRLVASVAGFMVLGIAVWAWRSYRRSPAIFYPSLAVLAMIIVQAGLGGAAVLSELPPEVVAVHLGMAIIILTTLGVITATAFDMRQPFRRVAASLSLRRLAWVALGGTLVLMLVGSYVSGAGYGLACSGWPLCNNQVIPTEGGVSVYMHFLHRLLALAVGIVLVALLWQTWREKGRSGLVLPLAAAAFLVFVVQSLIGAANIWTQLGEAVSASHLAVATLLWVVLAVLNINVQRLYERLPRSSSNAATRDLATGMSR